MIFELDFKSINFLIRDPIKTIQLWPPKNYTNTVYRQRQNVCTSHNIIHHLQQSNEIYNLNVGLMTHTYFVRSNSRTNWRNCSTLHLSRPLMGLFNYTISPHNKSRLLIKQLFTQCSTIRNSVTDQKLEAPEAGAETTQDH